MDKVANFQHLGRDTAATVGNADARFGPRSRREVVNTRQRFDALREAERRARAYRGSMAWSRTNGKEFAAHMPHLPLKRAELRMLPAAVFEAAATLFVGM